MGIFDNAIKAKNRAVALGRSAQAYNKKHNVSGNFKKFMDAGSRAYAAGGKYDRNFEKAIRDL